MPQEQNRGTDLPKKEKPKLEMGENYLFIVGINKYQDHQLPRLNNAVVDAKKVRDLLVEKYQFTSEEGKLKELYDEDATQSNIINSLKQFVLSIGEKDNLLIYFAGHGEYDKHFDVGYWIPHDGKLGQIGSYLSFDLVTRSLNAIKSRHTFIMTDSCYAGSIFTTNRSSRVKDRLESIASRWLLTAGRNEPVPDGKPGDHSPFAKAVLYHLNANQEKRFRVSTFCDNILDAVGNNSDALPRYGALNKVGDMGGEFMFRLKEYAHTVFEKVETTPARVDNGPKRSAESSVPPSPKEQVKKEVEQPMRTIEDVRKKLKKLVAEGDFEVVFEFLTTIISDDSRRVNDMIMQQSQYNGISKQMRNGLVDPSFGQITLNRIRFALNSLADDLETEDLKNGVLEPEVAPGEESRTGSDYLEDLERQGLEQEAELLTKKLNFLKTEKVKAYDASQKFALQEQIEEIERQLEVVKGKLK